MIAEGIIRCLRQHEYANAESFADGPRPQLGAPDRDEYLALLGALGGLVGLALASTGENTD